MDDESLGNARGLFRALEKARDDARVLDMVAGGGPGGWDPMAGRAISKKEEVKRLEGMAVRAVASLPSERWAAAVYGRYVQGHSASVVAREMGVSKSTVYVYLADAIKWLDSGATRPWNEM